MKHYFPTIIFAVVFSRITWRNIRKHQKKWVCFDFFEDRKWDENAKRSDYLAAFWLADNGAQMEIRNLVKLTAGTEKMNTHESEEGKGTAIKSICKVYFFRCCPGKSKNHNDSAILSRMSNVHLCCHNRGIKGNIVVVKLFNWLSLCFPYACCIGQVRLHKIVGWGHPHSDVPFLLS